MRVGLDELWSSFQAKPFQDELHTRNHCHPSRQGIPQVKAAGMWKLELSASAGAWAGLREFQEPNPSSNTLGKGKHGASFPASKINPTPGFPHLSLQPEPKPLEPEKAGKSSCDFFFFSGRAWFFICLPELCQEAATCTRDVQDVLYSKTHGAVPLGKPSRQSWECKRHFKSHKLLQRPLH